MLFTTMQEAVNWVIAAKREKNANYNPAHDSGLIGDAFEIAIKDYFGRPLVMSPAGRCDIRIGRRNYEIKTGSGELGRTPKTLLRGSGAVIYCPVVALDLPITRQEAFVQDKLVFIEALDRAGAMRSKTSKDGIVNITIQTFWNRKKNAPHGRLYAKLLEALYEAEGEMFEDFLGK